MSRSREAKLERRALLALVRSTDTGCAGSSMDVTSALVPVGPLPSSASSAGTTGSTPASAPAATPGASLSDAHARRAPRGGRSLGTIAAGGGGAVQRADTAGSSFPSVLIPALLALLLATALALPETRRRLRPAGASSPADPAAPVPTRQARPPVTASNGETRDLPQIRSRVARMDKAMGQMAADVYAAMAGDPPGTPQSGPEADPQGEVEPEAAADEPAPE